MDTFGSRLKSLRQKKGLTQRELAKLIGAKHNSISDWENDGHKPDMDTIESRVSNKSDSFEIIRQRLPCKTFKTRHFV